MLTVKVVKKIRAHMKAYEKRNVLSYEQYGLRHDTLYIVCRRDQPVLLTIQWDDLPYLHGERDVSAL